MSAQISRFAKNSLWMILSRFAAQGLAAVFTILLARRLGSAGFGAYAFIAAIIFVANALTTFGTDMLLIREIAAKEDLSGLPVALVIQLVLSLLFIAVVWLFGARIPNQSLETTAALKIYSLALVPLAFFTVFTTALRGKQFLDAYALLNIIVSALQVGAVLMLSEKGLILLSSLLLSVQVIAAIFAGGLCAVAIPNFGSAWRFHFFSLSSFLKVTGPIALLTLFTMLYQRLNVAMLSLMTDSTQTGLFSAAVRMVEASKTAHIAVFAALYPALAQEVGRWSSQREAKPGGQSSALKLLFAGAAVISVGMFVFARSLVTLLFGNEFAASADVLKILAWILVPFTVNSYLSLSFLASNQERRVGRALAVSLLGLVILNLWWIPARGPEGSAWAALLAECLQSVALLWGASSRILLKGDVHEFSKLS